MKKTLLLILGFILLLSFVGCQYNQSSEPLGDDRVVLKLPTSEPINLDTEELPLEEEEPVNETEKPPLTEEELAEEETIPEGPLTSKDDVARYLFTYGELPPNFITKGDARDLGWDAQKGNLWEVTDHMSIGGDRFGNREGLLPKKEGRQYYEADIDYDGGYRGAKRIVYSNDGLVFYTDDHYESFEELHEEDYQ